jgi:hypothetical protein
MRQRSFLQLLGCVLVAPLLLAGCATAPRSIEIPQARLEAALARRFPYETRLGDLLVAKASEPRLTLCRTATGCSSNSRSRPPTASCTARSAAARP